MMKMKKSILELIKTRSSWRKYTRREIAGSIKQDILDLVSSPLQGPFHNRVRFRLVDKDICEKEAPVKLGTYGFISGAGNFLAGAVKEKEKNFEDYGYLLEKLILYCTDLGLATCWLGGSFKRGEFGKALKTADDEIIPAVTPVGYASNNRGYRDRFIRMAAGSKHRKPWRELFFADDFSNPLTPEAASDYAVPLEMVRLAPSASNNQPWRIVKENNFFHFFLKRTKHYDKMIKTADMQRIDMGIAMCHFELTAAELNLKGKWQTGERIRFTREPGREVEYIVSWAAVNRRGGLDRN